MLPPTLPRTFRRGWLVACLVALPEIAAIPPAHAATAVAQPAVTGPGAPIGQAMFEMDALPQEISPRGLVRMRMAMLGRSSVIAWTLKAGTVLPMHHHAEEQINVVRSGRLLVRTHGRHKTLGPGETVLLPSREPHGFIALEDTTFYDIQSPAREDLLVPGAVARLLERIEAAQPTRG